MSTAMAFDPICDKPADRLLLAHEERLQELEKLRPPHEALGNYQDVAKLLLDNTESIGDHLADAKHWIMRYLITFQRLGPKSCRIEQTWQLQDMAKYGQWADIGYFICHTMQMCHGPLMSWRDDVPFQIGTDPRPATAINGMPNPSHFISTFLNIAAQGPPAGLGFPLPDNIHQANNNQMPAE